ncbi:MAG: response regulator transcription factor [Clostridiales bacterium]|nr:response regulator transcription factor [Clostridiales bacterium]
MIYILEDDEGIRNLVTYALNGAGMEAKGFEFPSDFFAAVNAETPEIVLLDIMLPQEDGLSVLKKLRADARTADTAVIILTAKDTEFDRIMGLDCGADDYVTKPFSLLELMARIRALRRRMPVQKDGKEWQVGALHVSEAEHSVAAAGQSVNLTRKEFELLCLLLKNRGTVLSRDVILDRVWGYSFDGENRTVDVHIRTLRSKLGECGFLIETVRGVGYRIAK